MTRFDLTRTEDPSGIVILKLTGSLDADTVHRWESALDEVLSTKGVRILVDLEHLDYISSAGIGTFIGCIGEIREHDGDIVFLNTSPRVLRVFRLLGFTKLFEVTDDLEEARRILLES